MLALVAVGLTLGFQEEPLSPIESLRKAAALGSKGRLVEQCAVLQKAFDTGTKNERKLYSWPLAITLGALGEEERAKIAFEASTKVPAPITPEIRAELDAAKREDAIAAITKLARGSQIVMINEAHHMQQHRAFSLLVAMALRKIGYRYFAAEAFEPQAPEILNNGAPTPAIGEFFRDPFFADLARQTVKLGYKPVAYEIESAPDGNDIYAIVNSRDQAEAENLVSRILKQDPSAKILIHCGFSHITLTWEPLKDGREIAWLAARLKKLTGIDPLTIDQVGGTDRAPFERSLPEYRHAYLKDWLVKSIVFKANGAYTAYGTWRGKVDLQVFHPRTTLHNGRPSWASMGGYRIPLPIEPKWCPKSGSVLLQAFLSSEPQGSIPMDQIILKPISQTNLMLPPGRYRIVSIDENGTATNLGERITNHP